MRRLETERRAVSIMTIHKAKGLQFPVVALPDLADRYSGSRYDRGWTTSMLHVDGQLSIDLYTDMSSDREAIKQAEEQAEDLRLVYVAATRAQSRLIAWWANTKFNTSTSPLHRLLNADKDSALPPALNIAGVAIRTSGHWTVKWLTWCRCRARPELPRCRAPPIWLPGWRHASSMTTSIVTGRALPTVG